MAWAIRLSGKDRVQVSCGLNISVSIWPTGTWKAWGILCLKCFMVLQWKLNRPECESTVWQKNEVTDLHVFFWQASPPAFCPEGRTHDLFAIISVISAAHKFVYISVMDYFPTSRFVHPERYDFNPDQTGWLPNLGCFKGRCMILSL